MRKNKEIEITPEEEQEYLAYQCEADVLGNWESGLKSLDGLIKKPEEEPVVLICGGMAAFDRGLLDFINRWGRLCPGLFLVSEVTAQYRRYTSNNINIPFICTPHLLAKEMIILGMKISVSPEMEKTVKTVPYLNEAALNLNARHIGLGTGYATAFAYYAYLYIHKLLDMLQPSKVVLWNEFYAFHHIFTGVCRDRKIPLGFMEFGCIPGTICIEEAGQQGESLPAREPEAFSQLEVTTKEKKRAKRVWNYLKRCGLNRNPQPVQKIVWEQLHSYRAGRKTIGYMGQNDYESGMYPYTENTKRYHSPIFHSTLECLEYLRLLAYRNDWNLLYKPHPIMAALGHAEETGEGRALNNVNLNEAIDACDLIVTILSQSAYIALIRKKPVLMLGYTQLKGKGCSYEAFSKAVIEDIIKKALLLGYTKEQKNSFQTHLAQLFKYYLLDDGTKRSMRFGLSLEEFNPTFYEI